jgi:hypothetical protein
VEAQFIFAPGEESKAARETVEFLAGIVNEEIVIACEQPFRLLPFLGKGERFIARQELGPKQWQRLASIVSWRGTFDRGTP